MRRLVRIVLCTVLVAPLLSFNSPDLRAQTPVPSSSSADPLYAPLIDSVEAATLQETADLARYTIVARLTEASVQQNATIIGEVTVDYLNQTGEDLDGIPFRLYGNNLEYAEGAQTLDDVTVDGEPAEAESDLDDTLVTVLLPKSAEDGEAVSISYSFTTTLPTDPALSYGMFKYDTGTDTYSLAHWFPLLAGWDDVYGWNTGPISVNGDPVFTEAAVFDVTLTAPADLVIVTSGSELERADAGQMSTRHYASGPSRDFVMAASPNFQMIETKVGETTVRSYAWPDSESGSELVLESGAASLALYNELIGPYPYEEMDLVQVNIGNGAGGVEFPGLVYIGSDFYSQASEAQMPGFLEFIVVHEIAHQWFYGVIGNNQYQHAFIDESMANYLSIVYFAATYGTEEAHHQANLQLRLSYFDLLFQEGDQVVDQPTDAFPTARDYGIIVYGKGALGFQALRHEIGTDAFFEGLASYYHDFSFKVAQPEDLRAAFEEAAGEELTEFWSHWFEQPGGEEDFDAADLARLLRELDE